MVCAVQCSAAMYSWTAAECLVSRDASVRRIRLNGKTDCSGVRFHGPAVMSTKTDKQPCSPDLDPEKRVQRNLESSQTRQSGKVWKIAGYTFEPHSSLEP